MKKIRNSATSTVAKKTDAGTPRRCAGSAAKDKTARTIKRALGVGVLSLFVTIAQADYVGTLTNRIFVDPEGITDILDGYDVGDEISFIFETTPAPNGDRGIAAWSTIYVPPGVVVIGAELVQADGDGTYSQVGAKDVAPGHDDCGNRGCNFPTTGTSQNGRINEVQQDTGVFYSADAQTALLGTPLSLSPTGPAVTPQSVFNQWDFNQTTAFGIAAALSGNGGKGNTPVVDVANDGVFLGTGSPVAGSGSYYQNDYDPSCNASAVFEDDLGCQGPWQRIRHNGAKIGGTGAIVPATTGATEPLLNTAVLTTAGHDFATDGDLPAGTNAVRYVQGIRRIGDLEIGRITFRITDVAAFTASFTAGSGSEDSFCLDATGGDLDKGDFGDPTRRGAQDNPWRYYEGNAHECFSGSVDGVLVKVGEFVNGDPTGGISLQNDVVGYGITFYNTTNASLFDIDLADTVLENLSLVDFSDPDCPYTSYDGNQGGLPTLATRTATDATWNRLDSLGAGDSVVVHMCATVTSTVSGDQVRNEAQVDFATVDTGPQQSLTSVALGIISTRITGTVFSDDDSDTDFSGGDGTLAGVTVELYNGADLVATTTTNAAGFYQFNGHPADNYTIVAIDPPGFSSVRDIDTAPPCVGNNCNEIAITLVNKSVDNDFLDDATGNAIQGTVFADLDADGTEDLPEDVGQSAVTVRLYDDVNGNGVLDGPDTLITTTVTASDGSYSFDLSGASALGDFVLEIDTSTLPASSVLTTDNVESASFVDFGNTDADNDFGFIGPSTLVVTKASGAVGDVMAGDAIVYTIRPSNVGTGLLTNVEASDAIPANTSFVSATPAQDSGPDPVVWELGSNTAGIVGTTTSGSCVAFAASLDTFIEEKNPTNNHGGENELKNKNKAADSKRSLVEWDLSCLPANSLVTSATMSFYVTKEKNTSVQIFRMTQDWTEGGATWNTHDGSNAWTTAGGDFSPTVEGTFSPTTKNVYENVIVTSLVQSWASGTANEGVILVSTHQDEAKLGTSENGGKEPLLAISFGHITSLTASSLVTDGDVITVTMTLDSSTSDTNVTPGTLNVTGAGGAGAVCGSPTPASQAITAGTPISFTWSCTASAGTTGGSVTFDANATGDSETFATATSNSSLVSPALQMTVQVDNPLDINVTGITNTVLLSSSTTPPAIANVRDVVSRGGTIGDRVWLDVDGDGVQDVGEPGLSNVELTLFDAGGDMMVGGGDDTVVSTTLSGADGNYLFTHVPPGTYYVDVTDATVPSGLSSSPGTPDPSATVTVTAEEIFVELDFGYTNAAATAVIGDRVWSDANQDGILDPGEVGIGGVSVELRSAGVDGILGTPDDIVEDTETTAVDGSYLFTGVAAGDYIVAVDESSAALTGYSFSNGPQSVSNPSPPLTVAAGDAYLNADFAYFNASTFSISDRVWSDSNADGIQASSEPGIAGVVVNLVDLGADMMVGGGDDQVIVSVTTDANGDFSFSGLENGSYNIEIADTDGVLSGFGGTTQPGRDFELGVTLADSDISAVSFGYNGSGRIGDTVWSDADGDGVQDPGEPGIAGVSVELWMDANGDGAFDNTVDTLLDTKITGDDGTYLFEGLVTGNFFVSVDDTQANLAGSTPTTTDDETGGNAPGTQIEVALTSLTSAFLDADFGYQNTALADVSGNVWEDLNADGLDAGAGEPGIDGVTVALVSAGGVTVATTTTDANGDYTFPDVAAGNYSVEITDATRRLEGYRLTSGRDQIPVTVAAADITGIDFGYVRDAGTGSIGDLVWLDGNGDGIRNGAENGVAGVTVELYDPGADGAPGGGDDILLATTTSDVNGGYRFTGLAAGDYFAQVDTSTLPGGGAGLTATTSNPSTLVNLGQGEAYRDADFGFASSGGVAALGDFVWYDADSDGVQDPGEVGIGGVQIRITGPGCAPCTTTTAADGSYLFTNLTPGAFSVTYDPLTLPAGYNTVAINGNPQFAEPAAGEIDPSVDFGFDAPAGTTGTIGDFVWLDEDGDGVQDGGEPGIEGVTLNLLDDATGNILASTTTDSSGAFDFVGVPAGSYMVEVSDIFEALDGLALSGGTNPTSTIVLAAGGDHNTADFGYQPARGSIGNLVWHDVNGDGDRDTGEAGLSRVTVELWHDVNGNGSIDSGTDNLIRETTTNLAGEYAFTGLVPGDYLITVNDRNGILTGFDTLTSGTPNTDNNSQADPYAVTLPVGGGSLTADFGYFDSAAANALSGLAYFDLDGDGVIDSGDDLGVGRVLMLLFKDLDGDGVLDPEDALIGSQSGVFGGASQGQYSFLNLPDGDYIVAADATGTFLDGSIQTTQLASAGIQPATISGADSLNNDFGFHLRATVVVVSELSAFVDGGQVVVEWQTAAESNSAGFYLYRWDTEHDDYVRVNERMVPTLFGAPQGGVYRLIDRTASPAEGQTYLLMEIQAQGIDQFYGPYDVEMDWRPGYEKRAPAESWYEARPHEPSAKDRLRRRLRQAEIARSLGARRNLAKKKKSKGQAKIKVLADGLQYVSLETLAGLFDVDLSSLLKWVQKRHLSLRHQGGEVAWLADGNGAGIYFYGQGIDSLYTSENIYWLELDKKGRSMEHRASGNPAPVPVGSFRTKVHLEEDLFAGTVVARDPDTDYWHWKGLYGGHPTIGSHTFTLNVNDVASSGVDAILTIAVRGASESDVASEHHAIVSVNGSQVGETYWDGLSDHTASFNFPHGLLVDGGNAVEVKAMLDTGAAISLFYIDSFDIEYQRLYLAHDEQLFGGGDDNEVVTVDGFGSASISVFDLGDPKRPVLLADGAISVGAMGYQVSFVPLTGESPFLAVDLMAARIPELIVDKPSTLRDRANRADYLIVTSGELTAAAEALADYRRLHGWEAMVVEIEDVMDEFNDGLFDPNSLREFLSYAYLEWQLGPKVVVLAGAGHFDYRDIYGLGGNVVPPLMAGTPFGIYASDARFADVVGDPLPELQIGRLPVMTSAELDAVVRKIVTYEAAQGDRTDNVVLAADKTDIGGNFGMSSDGVAALLNDFEIQRIYLDEMSFAAARDLLLVEIEEGVALVNYLGHGGLDRLAANGLLTTNDVDDLANLDRYFILTSLTCNMARFDIPGFASLGEALVLEPDGGAVAVWAPTGLALNFDSQILGEAFAGAFADPQIRTIGDAIQTALEVFAADGHYSFVPQVYNLLGDPATVIP